jgi:hypothetical protein
MVIPRYVKADAPLKVGFGNYPVDVADTIGRIDMDRPALCGS